MYTGSRRYFSLVEMSTKGNGCNSGHWKKWAVNDIFGDFSSLRELGAKFVHDMVIDNETTQCNFSNTRKTTIADKSISVKKGFSPLASRMGVHNCTEFSTEQL